MDQELPTRPQKKEQAALISESTGGKTGVPLPLPVWGVGLPTFGIVPVDSFSDQGLPLPERGPQEVMGPTADLHHLSWGVHE